jgi:hypothetical protein
VDNKLGPWIVVQDDDKVVGKQRIPDDLYPFHKHGNPSRPCADETTISLQDAIAEYDSAIKRVQRAALEMAFWATLVGDSG